MAATVPRVLTCRKCQAPLPSGVLASTGLSTCPFCGVGMYAAVFPAMVRPAAVGTTGEALLADTEASCFYHHGKRAATACERCGRFLCTLCDVEFGSQHVCPACIERSREGKADVSLDAYRLLYDDIAVAMAVLPLLMWFITIFTAPATLFIVVRYWRKPLGVTRRSRWRFVAAAVFALVQVAGWCWLLVSMLAKI